MSKECKHQDKFEIEKSFLVNGWGKSFLKSVSFFICADCGQMFNLEGK